MNYFIGQDAFWFSVVHWQHALLMGLSGGPHGASHSIQVSPLEGQRHRLAVRPRPLCGIPPAQSTPGGLRAGGAPWADVCRGTGYFTGLGRCLAGAALSRKNSMTEAQLSIQLWRATPHFGPGSRSKTYRGHLAAGLSGT
jgi:hypothetical protein